MRDVNNERLEADGITGIDIVTGGFPCQDLSVAGKQAGIEGERSGLWGELCRIIGDIRPSYAIVENVTALISGDRGGWFSRVLGDLAEIGYDAEWHCIPASSVGAIHDRDRVWIIAYPYEKRFRHGFNLIGKDDVFYGRERFTEEDEPKWKEVLCGIRENFLTRDWDALKARVCRVDDGVSTDVDRCRSLGNSVVPQIPELLGRAIMREARCAG